MPAAKRQFRFAPLAGPEARRAQLHFVARVSLPQHAVRSSIPLAQFHPRNTVCVRKHSVRQSVRAAVTARYRLRWFTRAGFWCAMLAAPRIRCRRVEFNLR